MKQNNAFAEIIESSLQHWLAQSWSWDCFPRFGSLVAVEGDKDQLFGVVYAVQTGSMDPTRYPFPYQKTQEELLAEQPQIFAFLKTTFSCLPLGYEHTNKIVHQLPPEPPKIHSFVRATSTNEQQRFFAQNGYMHLLCNASQISVNLDELLLAIIKQRADAGELTSTAIEHIIDQFTLYTGSDYRRLKLFLQRVDPLVKDMHHV